MFPSTARTHVVSVGLDIGSAGPYELLTFSEPSVIYYLRANTTGEPGYSSDTLFVCREDGDDSYLLSTPRNVGNDWQETWLHFPCEGTVRVYATAVAEDQALMTTIIYAPITTTDMNCGTTTTSPCFTEQQGSFLFTTLIGTTLVLLLATFFFLAFYFKRR